MATEICYFSGTGNSLAVARDLAARLEARLYPMAAVLDGRETVGDAETVGLVFPVYHKSIPWIVQRLVGRMGPLSNRYLFAVCTYGDSLGFAPRDLARALSTQGGALAAAWGIRMPYNYLTPSPVIRGFLSSFTLRRISPEAQQALQARAPQEIAQIYTRVRQRFHDERFERVHPLTAWADRLALPEKVGKWVWLKVAGVNDAPADEPFIESRRLMDYGFFADSRCIGCGICAQICPVQDISMVSNRPRWAHRCEQCFACLQWCPQQALQFGAKTVDAPRYHHPAITLTDMQRQAGSL